MPITDTDNSWGAWAFLIGVVLAVVIGLASTALLSFPIITEFKSAIYAILMILGIVVGSVNVSGRDSQTFMIAGAVLVIVSSSGMNSVQGSLVGIGVGEIATSVFAALLTLFVPATIIVALKTVFSIAKV